MDEKAKYRLYVISPENIADDERHYLITPDYCLLYTQKERGEAEKAIEIKDIKSLPSVAKEWLNERIEMIRTEYLAEHKREILEAAEDFGRSFAQELEKIKQSKEA